MPLLSAYLGRCIQELEGLGLGYFIGIRRWLLNFSIDSNHPLKMSLHSELQVPCQVKVVQKRD